MFCHVLDGLSNEIMLAMVPLEPLLLCDWIGTLALVLTCIEGVDGLFGDVS